MRRSGQYLEFLRAVPMFSACSQKELAALARSGTIADVADGSVLCREGRPGREFFVIIDGKATVTRGGRNLATLGSGDFFGELALLDNTQRDATVTATGPLSVFVMTASEFNAVLKSSPSVTRKLLVGMARRLHELDRRT